MANPLRTKELSATLAAMSSLADRARLRLREEMSRKHLSQRELADLLKWSQSRVARAMTGRSGIALDDLDALCFGVGLSVVEAVRDHGLEFLAEMTPTELRVLERIRQLPRPTLDALMTLLNVPANTRLQERRAAPEKKRNVR